MCVLCSFIELIIFLLQAKTERQESQGVPIFRLIIYMVHRIHHTHTYTHSRSRSSTQQCVGAWAFGGENLRIFHQLQERVRITMVMAVKRVKDWTYELAVSLSRYLSSSHFMLKHVLANLISHLLCSSSCGLKPKIPGMRKIGSNLPPTSTRVFSPISFPNRLTSVGVHAATRQCVGAWAFGGENLRIPVPVPKTRSAR